MFDIEVLGEELVLGFDVVVEGDCGKGGDVRIGWGDGFAIAEKGGDDYEIFRWVEGLVVANKPLIVGDGAGVPRWI